MNVTIIFTFLPVNKTDWGHSKRHYSQALLVSQFVMLPQAEGTVVVSAGIFPEV